jgi:NADPH:quinone reductase-like Zn-dependent oxidoreductase
MALRMEDRRQAAADEPHGPADGGPVVTREPQLLGQTVVLIGGSAGIGLETARLARAEGADVVLAARNPERLEQAARDVDARSTAALRRDRCGSARAVLRWPGPIDHVLVTGPGPSYCPCWR